MANYTLTPEIREIRTNVRKFMDEHIYPNEEIIEDGEPAQVESLIKDLQSRTKKMGYWAPHLPKEAGGMGGLDLGTLGIPSEAEHIDAYRRRVGRGPLDPDHWDFYIAYNMFRAAGIAQGIMGRVVDGTAASEHALEVGRWARRMAEQGWQQVEKILARR